MGKRGVIASAAGIGAVGVGTSVYANSQSGAGSEQAGAVDLNGDGKVDQVDALIAQMPDAGGSASEAKHTPGAFEYTAEDFFRAGVDPKTGERVIHMLSEDEEGLFYAPESAQQMLEMAKANGTVGQLKELLYWNGFYGSDYQVDAGSDMVSVEDEEALYSAMDRANRNGGMSVNSMLLEGAQAAREVGSPLGQDFDPAETPQARIAAFAESHGLKLPDDFLSRQVTNIALGNDTTDGVLNRLLNKYVIPTYPAWQEELKAGMTMNDIAAPYKTRMAQVLQLPETAIDLEDPALAKALSNVDKDGKASYTPMWKFDQDLRNDKRWEYTDTAWSEVESLATGVMSRMGF